VKPRRHRWLSIAEVAAKLTELFPKLATKPQKRRLETVRRMVRRAERRDAARFTKRAGRDLFVSVDALSSLLPVDASMIDRLEVAVARLHQEHRQLAARVNGHGSKIRNLEQRADKTESFQTAAEAFLAAIAQQKSPDGRT
jgi:hypothetical protein